MTGNFPMAVENCTEESRKMKDKSKNKLIFSSISQKQFEGTVLLSPSNSLRVAAPTFKPRNSNLTFTDAPTFIPRNSNLTSIQNQDLKNTSKHQATPYPKRLSKHSDYLAMPPDRNKEFVASDSQSQTKMDSGFQETSTWENEISSHSPILPSRHVQKTIGYPENPRSRYRSTPYPKCQKSNLSLSEIQGNIKR